MRLRDAEDDGQHVRCDVLARYYCTKEGEASEQPPVFNATLGLAVEALRDDVTIEDLWNVA